MSIKPTEEFLAARKNLTAAEEVTHQAKNAEATAILNLKIAKQAGNAALFIPIADLSKYGNKLSKSDQNLLKRIPHKLKGKRFFLGECAFESKKHAPEALGITANEVSALSRLMRQSNFDFNTFHNHNLADDLKEVRKKSKYVGNAGTGERDAVRAHLLTLFNSKNFSSLVTVEQIHQPDQTGSLTAIFNVNADLRAEIKDAELTNKDIAELIDYGFNRAAIREYIKDAESSISMDKAVDKYRSKNQVRVTLDDQFIKVSIPLSQSVKGTFRDGHLKPETFETAFEKEMNMGIQLALLKKQTTPIVRKLG